MKDCERVEKGGTGKSLKVFIGMKVPRGDQTLEHMADLLVEYACASGYHPLVAYREIARRQLAKPAEFMLWVRDWIGDSDLILILYHPELRGGLIETGIAYAQNKPIWLISQMDMKVSSSARGCANRLLFYSDPEDLKDQLQAAFGQLTGPDSAVGRSMEETHLMERKYTNHRFLDALQARVLIYDGAMGTNLQSQHLTVEQFGGERTNGCIDFLVISYPEAVRTVHRSFLEVGVDVIETDTFRANRLTLKEYGLQDRTLELNRKAAILARELADAYSTPEQPRFVAGSMGPTGLLPSADDPELSNISFDQLASTFQEQAVGLIQGGVDLLLIETSQDILEVKAVIHGIQQAFDATGVWLPIQAQVTLDTTGRMLLGTDIAAALTILEGLPIDVIGLNCSTGPEHMREPIRFLGENAVLPVSCIPNAGLPLNVDGEAVYPLQPEPFAQAMLEFVEKNNISVVGGCCGTTPAHLQLLVEKLGGSGHNRRAHPPRPATEVPRLSSSIRATLMHQEPPPLLIGERCNAQGSRKFKRILLAEDYDTILELGRDQVEGGAHALDISVAVTERPDEGELMRKVVKKLAMGVEVPLVIDTTEPDVMETALKTAPGRCLLNSTHLESGRQKADRVFGLAKEHNAAVLVLTIDENGMAKTAQRKLEVAQRLYEIAVQDHGLKPESLVYDTLTFTLATGDPEFANSAIETIEGIRLVKSRSARRTDFFGSQQCFLRPQPGRPPGVEQRDALSRRTGRIGYGYCQSCPHHTLCRNPI